MLGERLGVERGSATLLRRRWLEVAVGVVMTETSGFLFPVDNW